MSKREHPRPKASDAVWLSSAFLGRACAQAAIMLVFARDGGPSGAGDFALAFALSTPIFAFFEFALRDVYQTLAPRPSFITFFKLRTTSAFTAFLIVCLLQAKFPGPPTFVVMALAALKLADSVMDIFCGQLLSLSGSKAMACILLVNSVLSLLGIAAAVVLKWGPVSALAISAGVSFAILLVIGPRLLNQGRGQGHKETFAKIMRAAAPLGLSQSLNSALIYLPVLFLAGGASREEAGTFAAAYYAVTLANLFLGATQQAWMASLSRTYERAAPGEFRAATTSAVARLLILGLAGGIIVWALLPSAVSVIYGPGFIVHHVESLMLGLSVLALSAVTATALLQTVRNNYRAQLTSILVTLVLMIPLAWMLLKHASVFTAMSLVLMSFAVRGAIGAIQVRSSSSVA